MEAVRFLVERCEVKINTQDRFGMTPLNRAEQVTLARINIHVLGQDNFTSYNNHLGTSSRSCWIFGEKDYGTSWNKKSVRYGQYRGKLRSRARRPNLGWLNIMQIKTLYRLHFVAKTQKYGIFTLVLVGHFSEVLFLFHLVHQSEILCYSFKHFPWFL